MLFRLSVVVHDLILLSSIFGARSQTECHPIERVHGKMEKPARANITPNSLVLHFARMVIHSFLLQGGRVGREAELRIGDTYDEVWHVVRVEVDRVHIAQHAGIAHHIQLTNHTRQIDLAFSLQTSA
jgi:hypothetical protein